MTTVVLGWDGLDAQLCDEYGLTDAFGAAVREIETIENPTLGKPHTYELWPTLITGQTPAIHGIDAAEYVDGGAWNSRLLRWAQTVSRPIPDAVRWRVGRWLRSRGAGMRHRGPAYYADRGLTTVFDGRHSLALGIPNYHTDATETLDIPADRGAAMAEYLNVETAADGTTRHEPAIAAPRVRERLTAALGHRCGAVTAALQANYDLVWVWLPYLDTMGHLAPAVGSPDWQRHAYHQAAAWTAHIRSQCTADDTLLCVSDHGLRDGAHTAAAVFGGPAGLTEHTTSVTAVRAAVDGVTGPLDHREDDSDEEAAPAAVDATRDRLADLGYLPE